MVPVKSFKYARSYLKTMFINNLQHLHAQLVNPNIPSTRFMQPMYSLKVIRSLHGPSFVGEPRFDQEQALNWRPNTSECYIKCIHNLYS